MCSRLFGFVGGVLEMVKGDDMPFCFFAAVMKVRIGHVISEYFSTRSEYTISAVPWYVPQVPYHVRARSVLLTDTLKVY